MKSVEKVNEEQIRSLYLSKWHIEILLTNMSLNMCVLRYTQQMHTEKCTKWNGLTPTGGGKNERSNSKEHNVGQVVNNMTHLAALTEMTANK